MEIIPFLMNFIRRSYVSISRAYTCDYSTYYYTYAKTNQVSHDDFPLFRVYALAQETGG